jgi:hypothetical protein
VLTPKNARSRPVTQLCLALETFRRSDEGRVRDAKAFLGHFFPEERGTPTDRLFVHMPKEVRADLLSNWGIRGKKSALRDDDDRVRTTVGDALAAGDIDAAVVEEGVTPDILVDWLPLEDWWSFWRGVILPSGSVRKALGVARGLALFDDRWFFEHLSLATQKLQGTDVVCAALSKEQMVAWINAVHASGDASPTGLVAALGWDTILNKTAHDALLFALDALAREIGLSAEEQPLTAASPSATKPARLPPPATPAPSKVIPAEPVPASSKTPAISAKPAGPPPLGIKPVAGLPTARSNLALGAVNVEPTPAPVIEQAPASAGPPTARALFGVPDLPPMRPPQATLSGVGDEPPAPTTVASLAIAVPTFDAPPLEDPPWAPPRAEAGDMGFDIVYGVKRSMTTNVAPKYNFEDDDEPTSEISLDGRQS